MSNFPVRGTLSNQKSKTIEYTDEQNHLDEALKLINQLWAARLVDNISRPVDKNVKEQHINNFKHVLSSLHERLKRIMDDATEKGTTSKGKGKVGSANFKPREWTKYIRDIEDRYSQVLIDGSFKHFRRICLMLGLYYDSQAMEPINIERWANLCLNQKMEDGCC